MVMLIATETFCYGSSLLVRQRTFLSEPRIHKYIHIYMKTATYLPPQSLFKHYD